MLKGQLFHVKELCQNVPNCHRNHHAKFEMIRVIITCLNQQHVRTDHHYLHLNTFALPNKP